MKPQFVLASTLLLWTTTVTAQNASPDITESNPTEATKLESAFIQGIRQLTFEGRRAGEGYFGAEGRRLVFQSERQSGNPFFQIYLLDLETGDIQRISPGHGKTTCAWIHPTREQVLFASTHDDPDAQQKQRDELELRASGKERRYSWDYDEFFEIYRHDLASDGFVNLTNQKGYDAEGSWSPDGKWIAFASNRRAYTDAMTEEQKKAFKLDPAYMMDIYLMKSDGTEVKQLTKTPGYDGGPFFSPDGERICWRRFSENGALAEIMTMQPDGSDQRQMTRLGAMSWAPYYHPSGKYLIFTTNLHGFANFELYLVDVEAKSKPVRVTYTKGFDGLPAFTPDGNRIAWTTNRTASGQSQLFIGEWDHQRALASLGLVDDVDYQEAPALAAATEAAQASAQQTLPDFSAADALRHVDFLCRQDLGGRLTGSTGERQATAYVAAFFDSLGLDPFGSDGTWYQPFDFTSGVALGERNELAVGDQISALNKDWRPLAFSANGDFQAAPIVFAGYGITAPATEDHDDYDSYVHLDVKDKWVMVLRFMPNDISPESRQHLSSHSSLRYKAMQARDRGARGLIVVSGPNSKVKNELVPLRLDGALAGSSLPVISVTDELASQWLETADKDLQALHGKLDTGDLMMGFTLPNVEPRARIEIQKIRQQGRNVLGVLRAGERPAEQAILVGAHIDHLGTGMSSSSLARDDEKNGVHFGADDNASGIAAMLEIAEHLVNQRKEARLRLKRDVIFAAWSGEELGLLGSSHFVNALRASSHSHGDAPTRGHLDSERQGSVDQAGADHAHVSSSIYPRIAACLNMDMVGRLREKLILQGVGSSSIWPGEIERRNIPVGLSLTLQQDSYLPTDASSFFMQGVPILSAFTGSHSDYHTPRDTPNKLDYEGIARVSHFMGLVARSVATREEAPDFIPQNAPNKGQRRARMRAYLGTIPDYAAADVKGVKLSGVAQSGPAAQAGVVGGDVIVELAGKKIENIYDYTYAIEALKIGQTVSLVVDRNGRRIPLKLTPASRE